MLIQLFGFHDARKTVARGNLRILGVALDGRPGFLSRFDKLVRITFRPRDAYKTRA